MRELLVRPPTARYNQSDLETIALEVEQLTEAVKQDANTQYAGQYVFSGTRDHDRSLRAGRKRRIPGQRRNDQPRGRSRRVGDDHHQHLDAARQRRSLRRRQAARHVAHDRQTPARRHRRRPRRAGLDRPEEPRTRTSERSASCRRPPGRVTDQLQTAISRNEDLQGSISESLSNTDATNIAAASIAYSNEQAAYEAALRAGASIVQESLLNFLQ